jgi:hypothetical protein
MVVLIPAYLVGVGGLVGGAAVGLVVAWAAKNGRLPAWDARLTAPLLLAAAGGHLVLIPAVELERQVLFGLYALALLVTVAMGFAGVSIWRLGAVVFPTGSILGYAYFAVLAHHADYAGLAIKVVELAAIACAFTALVAARRRHERSPHEASG